MLHLAIRRPQAPPDGVAYPSASCRSAGGGRRAIQELEMPQPAIVSGLLRGGCARPTWWPHRREGKNCDLTHPSHLPTDAEGGPFPSMANRAYPCVRAKRNTNMRSMSLEYSACVSLASQCLSLRLEYLKPIPVNESSNSFRISFITYLPSNLLYSCGTVAVRVSSRAAWPQGRIYIGVEHGCQRRRDRGVREGGLRPDRKGADVKGLMALRRREGDLNPRHASERIRNPPSYQARRSRRVDLGIE